MDVTRMKTILAGVPHNTRGNRVVPPHQAAVAINFRGGGTQSATYPVNDVHQTGLHRPFGMEGTYKERAKKRDRLLATHLFSCPPLPMHLFLSVRNCIISTDLHDSTYPQHCESLSGLLLP